MQGGRVNTSRHWLFGTGLLSEQAETAEPERNRLVQKVVNQSIGRKGLVVEWQDQEVLVLHYVGEKP